MSRPEPRHRAFCLLGMAGVVVACGGGTAPGPTLDTNPYDSPSSSFEPGGAGAGSGSNCFPCGVRLRCQSNDDDDGDIEIPCEADDSAGPPIVRPNDDDDDDDDDDAPPSPMPGGAPGVRQGRSNRIAFRCGGAVEVSGQRVGTWSRAGESVNVCVDALGSRNCVSCVPSTRGSGGRRTSPSPIESTSPVDAPSSGSQASSSG